MSRNLDIKALSDFENQVDETFCKLKIVCGPFLFLLAQYHHTIHNFMIGSQKTGIRADQAKASTLLSNLSYVLPIMINSGTREFLDKNIDALYYLMNVDPKRDEITYATSYTNLFEVFPPFHRKKLKIEGYEDKTFSLNYWSDEIRDSDYIDIILGEISLPIADTSYPINPEALHRFILGFPDKIDYGQLILELKKLFQHHYYNSREAPILTDAGFFALSGVKKEEYRRFSAFWHSFSEFLIQAMIMIEQIQTKEKNPIQEEFLVTQTADLCFFRLSENFLLANLKLFTELNDFQIESLMRYFQIDLDEEHPDTAHCSDGYLPPILKIKGQLIIAPHAIKLFLQSRNLVYAANKLDTANFENKISSHLEPELISQALDILKTIPGIEVAINVEYGVGEIDIIAYSPDENLAIHFQVKGAIPPQGSRMIRSLEQRVIEAIKQLETFRNLPSDERDSILSKAFNRKVQRVDIFDAVLCRNYFGSEKVYLNRQNFLLVNLAILSSACLSTKKAPVLRRIVEKMKNMESDLVRLAAPKTEFASLEFDDVLIRFPLMKYEQKKLAKINVKIWNNALRVKPRLLQDWWGLRDLANIKIF